MVRQAAIKYLSATWPSASSSQHTASSQSGGGWHAAINWPAVSQQSAASSQQPSCNRYFHVFPYHSLMLYLCFDVVAHSDSVAQAALGHASQQLSCVWSAGAHGGALPPLRWINPQMRFWGYARSVSVVQAAVHNR